MNKRLEKQLVRYRTKVEQFNNELNAYIKTTGDNELPVIDSTVIDFTPVNPYEITDLPDGGFKVNANGTEIAVKVMTDEEGEEYIIGWDCGAHAYADTVKDTIAYDRRRLRKAWKVWCSEHPDDELEKDEEDE